MTAPEEAPAITLARIEGKLDHVIAQSGDHEHRIRALETQASASTDHEPRIKILEARSWPLPSLAILLSVAAVIIPLVR
ncbi:hypothetical protein ACWGIV_25845 [Streptomyces sp. NPDC054844]